MYRMNMYKNKIQTIFDVQYINRVSLKKVRKSLDFFGFIYLIITSISLFVIWFNAYFSETMATRVWVNTINEANIELILHIFGIICIFLFLTSGRIKWSE